MFFNPENIEKRYMSYADFIHHEKEIGATEEFCVDEAIGKSYYVQGIWYRNCNYCYALCYDAFILLI